MSGLKIKSPWVNCQNKMISNHFPTTSAVIILALYDLPKWKLDGR